MTMTTMTMVTALRATKLTMMATTTTMAMGDDKDDGATARRDMTTTTMATTKRSIPGVMGRSFTDSHLKDLHAVFIQNELVPLD